MKPRLTRTGCFVFAAILCALPALSAEDADASPAEESAWNQVLELYEKAKEAGEQVPQDVYEWAKQDLDRIGDWEYRVVDVRTRNASSIQTQLNVLGKDRWECIWIERFDDKSMFVFKRPVKSYLQNIKLSQLMKLIPRGDSGDSDD